MAVDLEERPAAPATPLLAELYAADEVAWLDLMAGLAAAGRAADLDLDHLAEYLTDMGISEWHAVESRLVVLLMHLLKWDYQPGKRIGSWASTVIVQRGTLRRTFRDSGTLRRHAEIEFADLYGDARRGAAAETGLPLAAFPPDCPYTLDAALFAPLADDPTAE